MKSFIDTLRERVILFDGAMGTEIYNRGVFINRCYDELSLTNPDMVREIHASYLAAGAEVLTTNTFGANRLRLSAFGLADKTVELNLAAVQLAREVAGDRAWVAGSVGPVGGQLAPVGKVSPGEAFQAAREQACILSENGADLIILETFGNLAELWQAVRGVRSATDLPIVASVTFRTEGLTYAQVSGLSTAAVAKRLSTWPIQALGVNCALGPRGILDVVESLVQLTDLPIIAQPNAGYPQVVDGRTIFLTGSEYMAEYARRLAQKGALGVGGCCGTTPKMIKEMRVFLRSISPAHRGPAPVVASPEDAKTEQPTGELPVPAAERTEFARRIASGKFCVSVELDPPRGINPHRAVEGAALLYRAGVDVVNIADGPRAVARMGPTALSQLVRNRVPPMETVVHYCCRDRNLLGMQMDLLGAHTLGLRNILAVTGDPPKMGTYPNATAVFDIDSIGLISFIQLLNRGLDFSGQPIG
ncbi:MAG TPA: bifunctional homocysteine S-methyltransferase/methylenetetrahydrofolate reductase, partial [Deltaproteobacteria bacterium]|nr:bifunctional homocysteine S-methyltransferase/methylenetetrahydrofolate reductase [Deltaproteobacteria bacterium]